MAGLLAKGMVPHESHHHMLKKTVDGVAEVVTRMATSLAFAVQPTVS
jgi:hypothetical protein